MTKVKGSIIQGIGDATKNLEVQRPFFIDAGLEEKFMQNGTINVDISPYKWEILKPDYILKDIKWKPSFRENFRFINLKVIYDGREYNGYMYDPSRAPHTNSIIEVLAESISGIRYGRLIELEISEDKLKIIK